MLKIRLSRTGKKSQPNFRVIVQEHAAAVKGGKVVELLGSYMPTTKEKTFSVDLERVKYWISVGAQPSDSVAALLKRNGLEGMDKFLEARDKKRKPKKEVEEVAAAPAPAPAPVEEPAPTQAEEPTPVEEIEPTPAEEPAPVEETEPKPVEEA